MSLCTNRKTKPSTYTTIFKQPVNVTKVEGESATLECAASPATGYTWTLNGITVRYEGSRIQGAGNLVINEVKKSDVGKYQCTAVGGSQNNHSQFAWLKVQGKNDLSLLFLVFFGIN